MGDVHDHSKEETAIFFEVITWIYGLVGTLCLVGYHELGLMVTHTHYLTYNEKCPWKSSDAHESSPVFGRNEKGKGLYCPI